VRARVAQVLEQATGFSRSLGVARVMSVWTMQMLLPGGDELAQRRRADRMLQRREYSRAFIGQRRLRRRLDDGGLRVGQLDGDGGRDRRRVG